MKKAIDEKVALEIISQLRRVNTALAGLKNQIDENFKALITDVRTYSSNVRLLFKDLSQMAIYFHTPGHMKSIGRRYLKICTGEINEIINNLQFHDIFIQRLGHIMDINEEILLELSVKRESKVSLPYTSMIGMIKSMSISQVAHIEKEYLKAFEKIKEYLTGLKEGIKETIGVISNEDKTSCITDKQLAEWTAYLEEWQKLLKDINKKIGKIGAEREVSLKTEVLQGLLEKFLVRYGTAYKESAGLEAKVKVIESINKRFTMESERELLRNAIQNAGYKNILQDESSQGQQQGDVDLF